MFAVGVGEIKTDINHTRSTCGPETVQAVAPAAAAAAAAAAATAERRGSNAQHEHGSYGYHQHQQWAVSVRFIRFAWYVRQLSSQLCQPPLAHRGGY
jgi:hypothetical protein